MKNNTKKIIILVTVYRDGKKNTNGRIPFKLEAEKKKLASRLTGLVLPPTAVQSGPDESK